MYRHNNTTDLKYPSFASPFIHVLDKEAFHCIYRICTIPKAQAFLTSEDSQNNSFSVVSTLFPFLSNSSATTTTIWLTTRRSGNLGVRPRSPSYRSFTLAMSIKILPFSLLQIHWSPQNYLPNPLLTIWSSSSNTNQKLSALTSSLLILLAVPKKRYTPHLQSHIKSSPNSVSFPQKLRHSSHPNRPSHRSPSPPVLHKFGTIAIHHYPPPPPKYLKHTKQGRKQPCTPCSSDGRRKTRRLIQFDLNPKLV